MGRSLFGNTVAAAQTVLSQLCGNRNANPGGFDTTTVSSDESTFPGGAWRRDSYSEEGSSRPRNSAAFQSNGSGYFAMMDELGDYTYVQGVVNSTNNSYARVYDADLNLVTSFPGSTYPNTFAVRLHNNVLYLFRVTSSQFLVTRINLPSGTPTTFTFNLPGGSGYSTDRALLFNWPVNGRFWAAFTSTSGTTQISIITFDIASNAISQQFSSIFGHHNTIYPFHVRADGLSVSVPTRRDDGNFGVGVFSAGGASWSSFGTDGHFRNPQSGNARIFCSSNRHLCPVTTDCVIDQTSVIYWDGSTFTEFVGHLQGGDSSVQTQGYNRGGNYWQFASGMASHPSMTVKNLLMNAPTSQIGGSGTYSVVRNGTGLTFTRINEVYVPSAITNKLPGNLVIDYLFNTSGWLSVLNVRENSMAQLATFTWSTNISGQNSFGHNPTSNSYFTCFVTSKGRFFILPIINTNSPGSTNVIKGQFPILLPAVTRTFKATVIGGGGATQGGTNGNSSSFAGISAAAGQTRTGFVSGSTVITSGPTRGTGGTGYGADAWGQGEDTAQAGQYGGGSGFVAFGDVTLEAGRVYFFSAGFGPQFGKQGAILLEQV